MHHNIPRGDLHQRHPLIIAVALALLLSGCIWPFPTCFEDEFMQLEIEASDLKQGAERDSAAQSSLIFGRLTIKDGNKERTGRPWGIVAVKDDQAVGVLTEYLVSGEAYYLLVPPGEYFLYHLHFFVEEGHLHVSFNVPREVGVYYLGTLVLEVYPGTMYEIWKADIVDEFDTAVAELRHRNPQFSGVAQRRLMRSGAPTREFVVPTTKHCGFIICHSYSCSLLRLWSTDD